MAAGCVSDFKLCVAKLYNSNCTEVNDNSVDLMHLFMSMEKVFEHGLKEFPSLFGDSKQYCWNVFEKLESCSKEFKIDLPYSLSMALDKVGECARVKSVVGKGRLFLRILAKNGSLGDLVLLLKENKRFLYQFYDRSRAVLTNDVQCQIFYSFIADFTRIKFDINIDNADFLDKTWKMPIYLTRDFVPCSHLGIRVRYLDSYYIITEFEENFYNDEDGFFELGDVITSLAGTALRGKVVDLQKLFTKECRTLLRFEIAKLRFKDGTLFKPILTILKKRGLENMLSPSKSHDYKTWPDDEALDLTSCYATLGEDGIVDSGGTSSLGSPIDHSVRFVGSLEMGTHGEMCYIEEAIDSILVEHPSPSSYMPVRVQLGELDISVWPIKPESSQHVTSSEPFFKHVYPRISAVGQKKQAMRYFCYIVGNNTCTIATDFIAYVFLCLNKAEASRITRGITNGFKRTNFAM